MDPRKFHEFLRPYAATLEASRPDTVCHYPEDKTAEAYNGSLVGQKE